MIKIFRQIRWQLAGSQQTRKYFKYAVGEIILVVIGILIALQINNWNEERKNSIRENKLKLALYEEFEKDLKQLEQKIEIRNIIIKSSVKLLHYIDSGKPSEIDSIKYYLPLTSFRPTFDPISTEVIDKSDLGLIKNEALRRLLTAWKIEVLQLKEDEVNWRSYVTNFRYAFELESSTSFARSTQIEFWRNRASKIFLLDSDSVQRITYPNPKEEIDYQSLLKVPFWDTYFTRAIQLNNDANLNSEVLKKRIQDIISLLQQKS